MSETADATVAAPGKMKGAIETLPASWYVEPSIYDRERRGVFAREWLLLGHEQEMPAPGDYLAETVAGWPLFVRRGRDGVLRGFHNVCRHRAGPLVWDGAGKCKAISCRYHGWVYDEEGRLAATPGFGEAADFDAADYPLHPVRVETWRGLVFVNLYGDAEPLDSALAGLVAECADLPLEAFRFHSRRSFAADANWKAYVDNLVEGYHISYLHPILDREIDAKNFTVLVGERFCRHEAPLREGGVNAGKWLWRFPNLAINVYEGGMSLERVMPEGPHRLRLELAYFFADVSESARESIDASLAMSQAVTGEDLEISALVQRNLAAGVYDKGRLSPRHENGTGYFQSLVRQAVASAPSG